MPAGAEPLPDHQTSFERRWGHLTRPHVRALAWLLDAPDLLDPAAPYWHGRIATLGAVNAADAAWLAALEHDPAPLVAALGSRFYSRLGLYAEKLMAFYYAQRGMLAAHGLQVRMPRPKGGQQTVGEFDFLLDEPAGLRHIEFASKFYLLDGHAANGDFDVLVGPNLADTLGRKMRKIFAQQLALGGHPAAQLALQQAGLRPVVAAQALVKGWLFHPPGMDAVIPGITPGHCRGTWRTLGDFAAVEEEGCFVVMPRLLWLAPLKIRATPDDAAVPSALSRAELADVLALQFATDASPVMVASVRQEGEWLLEEGRAFLVPDGWPAQAALRRANDARTSATD
ncbi:hypothetical protein IP91_01015 [Pseudoduganella lurida]|uniref:DUF1853 family protein n=1 Tax=Pseudoduganella lurida TaxID=1036180 RepID=A0A562RLL3_9BURK|nr:DUF1853 family protein [Pseudoduganella lurida]TWI69937.1 hypothetical protein IP91_01015 [Pseudoduganella lurida]